MYRIRKVFLLLCLAALLCCFSPSASASAEVIYVAGNPDLFPVEYYDTDDGIYRGVLPDFLQSISEEGRYQFEYIRPGATDRREEMAQNRQAELISGCTQADAVLAAVCPDSVLVFSAERDGVVTEYRLRFTEIADPALCAYLAERTAAADKGQIQGYLLDNAGSRGPGVWFYFLIGLLILAPILLVFLIVLVVRYKKRLHQRELAKDTDPVTGIGNLVYFKNYFGQYVNAHNRPLYCVVYFATDVDRLRRLCGSEETDCILQYIAGVLNDHTADTDILARVSDGGFAVAHLTAGPEALDRWIRPVFDRICSYSDQFSRSVKVELHAGVYALQSGDTDLDEMIFNAAQGARQAEQEDRAYTVCSSGLVDAYKEEGVLQAHTERALQQEEIQLFLQFYIDSVTHRIVGAEALSRWIHPEKGMLLPSRFIPLMEKEGTILQLDYYVVERVCRFLERLEREGAEDFFISCNLSRQTFMTDDLADRIEEIMSRYVFAHERLILELTENVMAKIPEQVRRNIVKLKAGGIRIALDDFGSGYASFDDLQNYLIDGLKLDKTLVDRVESEKGRAILKGIVEIGHSLGMTVLAEGAETLQQIEYLTAARCDVIQGFYFYQPMPQQEARKVLYSEKGLPFSD